MQVTMHLLGFFSPSKTYNNVLQKHNIIDDSMNVFIDDNSTTKINLFTNISHKPLNFLFVNKYSKKEFESDFIYHQWQNIIFKHYIE